MYRKTGSISLVTYSRTGSEKRQVLPWYFASAKEVTQYGRPGRVSTFPEQGSGLVWRAWDCGAFIFVTHSAHESSSHQVGGHARLSRAQSSRTELSSGR